MEQTDSQGHVEFAPGAPRCGARSRRNNGNPCRNPVVKNRGRCRIHGGAKGSGCRTPESILKSALAHTTHGLRTKAAIKERQEVRRSLAWCNDLALPSNQD